LARRICARNQLRPLPLGWNVSKDELSIGRVLLKIAGLALTGIALMMGAPFWFDTLSKFMRVRDTGNKPNPTQ
jgi:hypothetical protein